MVTRRTDSERGVFERPAETFAFDPRALQWIMDDIANPLNQIAQLIPDGVAVLDVGAGNGVLGRLLQFLGRHVTIDAIEPDPVARAAAQAHYRSMFEGTVEDFVKASGNNGGRYDLIVMADVIEHIANPAPMLEQIKALLVPGGRIVMSTPNVAFASVRIALFNGSFDYVESGILERTHLRFFTLKSLYSLFASVGLYPQAQYHCVRDPLHTEIQIDKLPRTSSLLRMLAHDELSSVYQFLFVLGLTPPATLVKKNLQAAAQYSTWSLRFLLQRVKGRLARTFHAAGKGQ